MCDPKGDMPLEAPAGLMGHLGGPGNLSTRTCPKLEPQQLASQLASWVSGSYGNQHPSLLTLAIIIGLSPHTRQHTSSLGRDRAGSTGYLPASSPSGGWCQFLGWFV